MSKTYKVLNHISGLFLKANGGWSQEGKAWASIGALRKAITLKLNNNHFKKTDLKDWSIVEFGIVDIHPAEELDML